MKHLKLVGGSGDDAIDMTANNGNVQLDMYGQGGNDHFVLHGLWSKIRVYGGAGIDVVVDQGVGDVELHNVEG